MTSILDSLKVPKRNIHKPLRISIYDYFKATEGNLIGDCISVKVESGIIKEKDHLVLMPLNIAVSVKAIQSADKDIVKIVGPGALCDISINLPNTFDPSYIKSG